MFGHVTLWRANVCFEKRTNLFVGAFVGDLLWNCTAAGTALGDG